MHPAVDSNAVSLCVLPGAGGFDRAPPRELALGRRPFAARAFRNPLPAAHHGRYELCAAENDAASDGRRSEPAEDDAVHAADVSLLLLDGVQRTGVILAHWQRRWACPAVVFQ